MDIHHYQQQEPAHASAPAGAPQEQGRPLEERLGRLEAQMMELREQVVRESSGCVRGRVGLALLEERRVGLGGYGNCKIEFGFKCTWRSSYMNGS